MPIDLLLVWMRPIVEYRYLYTLMALYLFFLIPGAVRAKSWLLLGITALLSLCCGEIANALNRLAFGLLSRKFCISNILNYSFYFCVDILLARGEAWLWHPIVTLSAVAAALALFVAFHGDVTVFSPVVKTVVALGFSMGLWTLFGRAPLLGGNRFLRYCGLHCLEIYVIHGFFTAGNRTILPLLGVTNAYVGIVLNYTINLVVPLLFALVCRKLGVYDLFFRPVSFIKSRGKKADKLPYRGEFSC